VSQTFGPLQEGTLVGRVVFHAQVAWIPYLSFLSVTPASIISRFLIPLGLLSLFFLSFRVLGGIWICQFHYVYIR
jgi:hypothetical protein